MEKEERTGAERRGIPDAIDPEDKRSQVDVDIDPLPDGELVITRSDLSSASGEGSPDVVSAAELFVTRAVFRSRAICTTRRTATS